MNPDSDREISGPDPRSVVAWHCGESGAILAALASYWQATAEERAAVCNGAGPEWLQAWLPRRERVLRWIANRLWFLDCREAFDIHDWDYARLPMTVAAMTEANDRLRDNLYRIIRSRERAPRWLTWLRIANADRYVYLVREWGFKAFFDRP